MWLLMLHSNSMTCGIGTSEWENVCRNAIKMEDEYLSREAIVDEVQELVIRVNTGESDEESDFFQIPNDPVHDVECELLS
jgi:hypothetical protein